MLGTRTEKQGVTSETSIAALRAACLTLSGASPNLMSAISLSQPFPAQELTREELEDFVTEVAGELGLFAVVEFSGTHVSVRLTRPAPAMQANDKEASAARAVQGETGVAILREIRSLRQRLSFTQRDTVRS